MNLSSIRKLYFLGIGGIGMSAVARYFLNEGVKIYGYDIAETVLTKKLVAEGMDIHYDIDVNKIPDDIDAVIITPAIPDHHAELIEIKKKGYPLYKRAEVLGLLSKEKTTIAIAGTHGKTTTSSIIAHILKYCGLDITAFLGGILAEQKSNFIKGHSDIVVLEADEYDRSFLHLHPHILAVLSMDADHLDIYKSVENMYAAYEQLCRQVQSGGTLIIDKKWLTHFSDSFTEDLEKSDVKIIDVAEDFAFENVRVEGSKYTFDYKGHSESIENIVTQLPGIHNVSNTAVAVTIALDYLKESGLIRESLYNFKGIKRRFEIVYDEEKVLVDDYAHHPEELKYAVSTINELYPEKSVLGIFQPHLYSRTQDFYREFAQELKHLENVILMPVYPAREEPIDGIGSEIIYNLIPIDNKWIVKDGAEMLDVIKKINAEIVMTIGAADLDKYHIDIIKILKENK
ncbi:UDP-N-acetylmuramate--L-alanine ligase [Saprospiraceae bacterium]|nr:UDP-N-acetylmuramate--L-alanine ligase [Saprospiraceae bacterium]